jgi:hypothetical protein
VRLHCWSVCEQLFIFHAATIVLKPFEAAAAAVGAGHKWQCLPHDMTMYILGGQLLAQNACAS